LSKAEYRQLTFAFADSPRGDGPAAPTDVSVGKAWLSLKAKVKEGNDSAAWTVDPDRLLSRSRTNSCCCLSERGSDLKSRMCDPQVRFRERPRGESPWAYSTGGERSFTSPPRRPPKSLAGSSQLDPFWAWAFLAVSTR
jgi:hypothetical protein